MKRLLQSMLFGLIGAAAFAIIPAGAQPETQGPYSDNGYDDGAYNGSGYGGYTSAYNPYYDPSNDPYYDPYCDYYTPPWGYPPDYCRYGLWYDPVYVSGAWYWGPIYYSWFFGAPWFWIN